MNKAKQIIILEKDGKETVLNSVWGINTGNGLIIINYMSDSFNEATYIIHQDEIDTVTLKF